MKNTIITLLIIIILAVVSSLGYNYYQENLGSFDDRNVITLMGSSSNLVSVPIASSNQNTTTTDAGGSVDDGGFTIQQLVNTGGIRQVWLNINAIGSTATSTLFIQVMGSPDGTNYYNIASSTDAAIYNKLATTTVSIAQKAIELDPGTATSTISIPVQIDGHRFTRFIIWGDNTVPATNDNIQAWITATLVRDKER